MFCQSCGSDKRRHMQLVCPSCWSRLPKSLQRRIYAAWNDGDETADYSAAVDAAFDILRGASRAGSEESDTNG